jgi:hypothetical protein
MAREAADFIKMPQKSSFFRVQMPQPGPFFCLQDPFALGILLQRGIADFLSAMPSPFLGVSSLNLAALRSGHFFALRLLRAGVVAASLMDVKSTSLAARPARKNAGAKD